LDHSDQAVEERLEPVEVDRPGVRPDNAMSEDLLVYVLGRIEPLAEVKDLR
jgi:hypothetical protein